MQSLTRIAILTTNDAGNPSPTPPHPVALYLGRLSPGSRRSQAQIIRVIAGWLGGGPFELQWHELRYPHVQAVRFRLAQRYSPATANRGLAATRGVLREVFRMGLMDAEAYGRARDVEPVRGSRVLRGRALEPDEIASLYRTCTGDTNRSARDLALLSLCLGAGLRRSEVAGLGLHDYDHHSRVLTVQGKGQKQRRVYVGACHARLVEGWIAKRGCSQGPLLRAISRADRILDRGLCGRRCVHRTWPGW